MDEDILSGSKVSMEETVTSLSSVKNNLEGLLSDLDQPTDCCSLAPDVSKLEQGLKTLKSNIEYLTGPYIQSGKKEMVSTLEELEAIRTKYKNLQREWDNQQEHLGRIQGDVLKLKSQLKNQSSFCASMGAIMGSLMWKTSRLPNVIEALLSTNRVSEFLCIVSGSLQSFLDTYNTSLPDVTTNETQFILSLVGTVANMASTSEGRQFLVTDPNGRELINLLLTTLPDVPEGTGDCLKRVILMSLYNLSINQMGLLMIMDKKELYNELTKNIEDDMNPELRLLSLRLLLSLTMQIPSCQIYDNINRSVPKSKINELTNTTDADMRLLAKDIISNLQQAASKFTDKPENRPFLEFNKCKRKPGDDKSSCSLLKLA